MVDNTSNSILERIANALERLAPPDKKLIIWIKVKVLFLNQIWFN